MSRPRGGFLGHNPAPAASALNSAAGGIWTLREAEELKRAGTWPFPFSSPTQISGLQLWLDASDASTLYDATTGGSLVAADGGVARWEDKSGNDRHATQGTAANRPARKTAIKNGLDVLRFDGSNDQLSVPSSTATFKFLHSTDATVFVAFKPGTTADPNAIYPVLDTCNRGFNTPGYALSFDDRSPSLNNALRCNVFNNVSPFNVISVVTNDKITPNAFSVVTATTKPAAAAASRFSARTNGGAAYGVNAATGTADTNNSATDLTISGRNTGEDVLNGDICEIIIYNSALSDTDRALVESYLIAKWSIT